MAKIIRADNMNRCTGCFSCMLVCSAVNKKNHSFNKSAIRVKSTGGLRSNYYATVCAGCVENIACIAACKTNALTPRDGGGVKFDASKCIGCKKCVDACSIMAISFDEDEHTPIICKHCGVCTKYCPHDCISMKERSELNAL